MLVFIVLLLSASVGAHVETDDTSHLSQIPKRMADLEEKLKVQEQIIEEQSELIRRLFEIINKDKNEKKLINTEKDTGNQWMRVDTENKTRHTDDKEGLNTEHTSGTSNNVERVDKRSYEKSSHLVWNRIQRAASGLCCSYVK
jgi:uncharacterized coiled-coil protein SlyX